MMTGHQSPLAQLFAQIIAQDESERAVSLAKLSAGAHHANLRREAHAHGSSCMRACGGWDVDSLGHNIESNFPDLDGDECDEIAASLFTKKVC